ncbi:Methyltransferase domain-containing protein [Desulfacinum infernum DSM 9756]|uniref:Methyltransferase domain-containing protein n=1 Tax=Desulfacinum infernum DSM 9756 TaxID=1121391 RepID=A0A1M5GJ88_9BACT|nr:class I SAM-dependent methyltransferase [Desulfacinum infernum]SHG03581.1 Methyltransferase domain-containing protein [Desulfacinum infernum DSM 9756]
MIRENVHIPPYFERRRPEILRLVPKEARKVLDVGCGSGRLGKDLKSRSQVTVHGIEIAEVPGRRAALPLDRVWIAPVERGARFARSGGHDCIVLADVLEHLRDPQRVLAHLAKNLAPGGTVVASVPNVQNQEVLLNLMAGRWNYTSEGLLDRTHLRFFTRQTARELSWAAGLRIENIGTVRDGSIRTVFLKKSPGRSAFWTVDREDFGVWQFLITAKRRDIRLSSPKMGVIVRTPKGSPYEKPSAGFQQLVEHFKPVWLVTVPRELPVPEDLSRLGADPTQVDWVIVLDSRVAISPGFVEGLVEACDLDPAIGVLVPGVYADPDFQRLVGVGFRWRFSNLRFDLVGLGDGETDWPDPVCVDSALPWAFAVRSEVLGAVRGFHGVNGQLF